MGCNPAKLTATTKRKAIERFWRLTRKSDQSCWIWTGALTYDGYGRIRPGTGHLYVTVHRFSWEMHHGSIPNGLCVLHRCDVRTCVNPSHLFLGTNRDNIDDMVRKGRTCKGRTVLPRARGENNGHAKVTEAIVRVIRKRHEVGESFAAIAREYGLHRGHVRAIVIGESWKHVSLEPPQ